MEEDKGRKIGIMGWHQMYNFGSQLQITALLQVIKNMGFYPEVINYAPGKRKYRVKRNTYFVFSWIFEKLPYKLNPEYLSEKKKQIFADYKKKYLNLSLKCDFSSELYLLNEQYDAFVCGSDQIWNPYTGDDKYFLDYVTNPSKKIAYAPSFGIDTIPNQYVKEKYYNLLKDFKAVSIRELGGKKLLNEIGIQNVSIVLDPTLLLNKEQWNALLYINDDNHEDYILCYFLGDIRKHLPYINRLHKKLQKEVVVIAARENDVKLPYHVYRDIGPKEFVELIHNSCFVCTDSFHGICFSVIYQKKFCVFERFHKHDKNNQNSRIDSILKILGLEQKKVCNVKFSNDILDMEWGKCEEKLDEMRKSSYMYLRNSLKDVNSSTSERMKKITNSCCGCGACQAVCKVNAIEMVKDNNGNIIANINSDICIQCGKCKNVCPFRAMDDLCELADASYYSFQSKSKEILLNSSSGGASFEILQHLHKQGYLVYGCIYDNKIGRAIHRCIENGEIYKTQGSKYLHSDTTDVMKEISQIKDRIVFVGSPCQVSAIDHILKESGIRDKAVLIDFVCHGVPSDYLWDKYLDEVKSKLNITETFSVKFRDKKYGWRKMVMVISGKKGEIFKKRSSRDLFYRFYLQGNCYSEQCYECCFRKKTAADIRIGDYWGKKYKNDKLGVSRIFAISEKGKHVISEMHNHARIVEFPIEQFFCEENLNNLNKPVYYDSLMKDLRTGQLQLKQIKKKYCDAWYIEYLYRLKNRLKNLIKR